LTGSRSRPRRRRYTRKLECPSCQGTEFAEAVDSAGKRSLGCVRCIVDTGQPTEPLSSLQTVSDPPRRLRPMRSR